MSVLVMEMGATSIQIPVFWIMQTERFPQINVQATKTIYSKLKYLQLINV